MGAIVEPGSSVPLTPTLAVSATATVAPAVPATAIPTRVATPSPAITEQPVAPVTPTAVPAVAQVYGLADLIGDLVAAGARVAPAPGRIVKPYLSANGVVLNVDGQPVQVFEYPDEATLENDVAGLAPDGSSIDGTALTWQIPPASGVAERCWFWRSPKTQRWSKGSANRLGRRSPAHSKQCNRPAHSTSEVFRNLGGLVYGSIVRGRPPRFRKTSEVE